MGRMVAPGMPLERSKDFRGTLRRLGSRLTRISLASSRW
jgi:hypothetical protein